MQLSIIIVSYNTHDEILKAIKSIVETSQNLEYEIIVVDNGSSDGSVGAIRSFYPSVQLIDVGENLWFTGGNNRGIRAAQGDYILSLNPDTIVHPGALQTMVEYLDTHPITGAVTSRMIFPDGKIQMNCSRLAGYLDLLLDYTVFGPLVGHWREKRRRDMWYADWDRESDRVVEVAPDSNLMIRQSVLTEIGLYDEQLKLYFTEDDLCRRITAAGHEVHYVAGATIVHDEHASVNKVQRLATQVYFNDLIAYTRKYFGRISALLLAGLVFPTRTAMYIKQSLVG
jgi:GT2 family glycosyltransferase